MSVLWSSGWSDSKRLPIFVPDSGSGSGSESEQERPRSASNASGSGSDSERDRDDDDDDGHERGKPSMNKVWAFKLTINVECVNLLL